nr:ABC transporter ATP-binding protein [Streptomyces sp. NBC_00857]
MSFTGVIKNFGAVRAVDGVDLDIPRGETVALLGRNGAGKSTTIGMLLGLDEPDAGAVRLFGGPPSRAVAAGQVGQVGQVGAMLQDARPIKRVTLRELVAFVASTFPRPLPVAESLDLAGLTEYADRRVDRLSGGQLQRVRFAVALAGSPELIVLDEPTAALDVEARRAFWTSMRAYAERGNTVLARRVHPRQPLRRPGLVHHTRHGSRRHHDRGADGLGARVRLVRRGLVPQGGEDLLIPGKARSRWITELKRRTTEPPTGDPTHHGIHHRTARCTDDPSQPKEPSELLERYSYRCREGR